MPEEEPNDRDTRFLGAGQLLIGRLLSLTQGNYIDFNSDDHEAIEEYSKVAAQCLYDFAIHVLIRTPQSELEGICDAIDAKVALRSTDDMTEWPNVDELVQKALAEYDARRKPKEG